MQMQNKDNGEVRTEYNNSNNKWKVNYKYNKKNNVRINRYKQWSNNSK